ncbi:MAG: oligosaccharide flippase family protein [Promethearchaeota archaeon]
MSNNSIEKKPTITRDHKILAKNSIYSFINTYLSYFSAMLSSFLMARLITQDDWGKLILALSYVGIASLILGFLPPGLGFSYNYYIPRYLALKQHMKLKSFVKLSLFLRFFSSIIVFIISFLIFLLFPGLFRNLENKVHLILMLSPLIIIYALEKEFLDLNRSFNQFNIVFILVLIKNCINIGGLLFCFLFITDTKIEVIALIYLFTSIIPFLTNVLIFIVYFQRKLKSTDGEKLSIKDLFKNLSIYGSQMSIQSFVISISDQIKVQSIGTFIGTEMVTGYSIADHYRQVSTGSMGSINKPLTISYSKLFITEKYKEIERTSNVFTHYFIFIMLLFTGILYFIGPIFLYIIYGESYLDFTLILRLTLLSVIFGVQGRLFTSLLQASNKVKYLLPYIIGTVTIKVVLFLLGLIYFGIVGALYGNMIASFIGLIISILLNYKLFKIKLDIIKTFSQYIFFFVALFLSLFFGTLFLDNLYLMILNTMNMPILENFRFLSLLSFLIIYFILIIIFKIITVSDIEMIDGFFNEEKRIHRLIKRGLHYLKKIVRH